MENIEKLYEIMYGDGKGIMIDLRLGRSLDCSKANEMKIILKKLIDEWKDKEFLPKKIFGLLIDFYPGAEACSYNYDTEDQQKIMKFADEILELTRYLYC